MKRTYGVSLMVFIGLILVLAGSMGLSQAQESTPTQPPPSEGESGEVDLQAAPLGTAFTYQGQLKNAGGPVNDTCNFQFSLWGDVSGGTQIGTTQTKSGVAVADGLFTVQLDFGAAAFQGDARWLAIAV
jgi:hypothetical protein